MTMPRASLSFQLLFNLLRAIKGHHIFTFRRPLAFAVIKVNEPSSRFRPLGYRGECFFVWVEGDQDAFDRLILVEHLAMDRIVARALEHDTQPTDRNQKHEPHKHGGAWESNRMSPAPYLAGKS